VVPQLRVAPDKEDAPEEASIMTGLCLLKLQPRQNLLPKSERLRQLYMRLRHRAFILGVAAACAAILLVLPLLEQKQNLEVEVTTLNTDLQSQTLLINQAQETIEQNKAYRNIIEFSRDRETFAKDAPVPVPVLLIMKSLSQALPDLVELDSYSCLIDPSGPFALIEMHGRPLSPDGDLVEMIARFRSMIKAQGWEVDEFHSEFKSTNASGSRFVQRGGLRKFTVSFRVNPNKGWRPL
jgi:cell division protein FtsL